MKRTYFAYLIGGGALLLMLLGLFFAGVFSPSKFEGYDEALDEYVLGFTSGEITRSSSILIQFAHDYGANEDPELYVDNEIIQFNPEIKGKLRWKNARTLEFVPGEKLPSGQRYIASLDLSDISDELKNGLPDLEFQFASMKQGFSVEMTRSKSFKSGDKSFQQLSGVVRTVDFAEAEIVEEILSSEVKDKDLKIKWEHDEANNTHTFTIDSLPRKKENYRLDLKWNAKKLGIAEKGEKQIEKGKEIPSISRRHATGKAHQRANKKKPKGKHPIQRKGKNIKKKEKKHRCMNLVWCMLFSHFLHTILVLNTSIVQFT